MEVKDIYFEVQHGSPQRFEFPKGFLTVIGKWECGWLFWVIPLLMTRKDVNSSKGAKKPSTWGFRLASNKGCNSVLLHPHDKAPSTFLGSPWKAAEGITANHSSCLWRAQAYSFLRTVLSHAIGTSHTWLFRFKLE